MLGASLGLDVGIPDVDGAKDGCKLGLVVVDGASDGADVGDLLFGEKVSSKSTGGGFGVAVVGFGVV